MKTQVKSPQLINLRYSATATAIVISVGLLVSAFQEHKEVDASLLAPAVESFMGFCPRRVRRWTAKKKILASSKCYGESDFEVEMTTKC